MFDYALRAFLFLSPIFCFRSFVPSIARGKFFIFGTIVLFIISLFSTQKRKLNQPLIGIFLLLAFVRMFFDNGIGAFESYNFWLSSSSFMYVFCGVLLFFLVYCYVEDTRKLFYSIAAVSVLNFILVSAQLLNLDFMWQTKQAISGFMDTPSQLGQYSAMSIPLLFFINPFLAVIPLFTLFITKSVSSILASALGLVVIAWYSRRRAIFLSLVGVAMAILISLNFGYIQAKFRCRPVQWQKTAKIALQKPYLGWGYRSFNDKVAGIIVKDTISGREYRRAHNDYLHNMQELGIPIVIIFCMFIYNIFKKFIAIKGKDRLTVCLMSSVIIVLINASGQTTLRYASISGTWIVLLALLTVKIDDHQI